MDVTNIATEEFISVGERSSDSLDDPTDSTAQDLFESKNRSKRKPSKTQIKHIAPKHIGDNCDTSKYGTQNIEVLFQDVTRGIYHVSEVQPHQQPVLTQGAEPGQLPSTRVQCANNSQRPKQSSQVSATPTGSPRSSSRPPPYYPCGICGKIFRVPGRYDSHMLGHSKGKPYCCNTCGKMFSSQIKLDQHLPVHNCDRSAAFTCEICGKVCVNWRAYLYHLKAKHTESGGKRYGCNLCGRQFHTGQRLGNHMASHEIGKNHCCHTCGKLFESQKKLDTHIMVHSLTSKHGQHLQCADCDKEYTEWIPFKQHMKTHGAEGVQYPCGLCEMMFPTQYEKEKHKRVHKQVQCEFCERYFRSASVLSVHLRVHTGERPYKCGLCERDFSQAAVLKVHMRTHRKEGRYECMRCGNVYMEVMEFYKHHLAHLEEGNLQCEECGKMFETINNKNRHMAAHRDQAGRACQVCGKEFGRMSHLEAHMLCHSDQLPLQCKVCGKMFSSQEILTAHYATHIGSEDVSNSGLPASKCPLFCGLCGKIFKGKVFLNNHMERHKRDGLNARGGEEIPDEELVVIEDGEFACTDCGKTFALKHHLSVHRREHTGERPHTCILCGQNFMYRRQLLEHIGEHKRNGLMLYGGAAGSNTTGKLGKTIETTIPKTERRSAQKVGGSGSETKTDNEDHNEAMSKSAIAAFREDNKHTVLVQVENTASFRDRYSQHQSNMYKDKLSADIEAFLPDETSSGNSRPVSVDLKDLSWQQGNKLYVQRSPLAYDRQYIVNQDGEFIDQDRQFNPNEDKQFNINQESRQFTPIQDRQFTPSHDSMVNDSQERQFNYPQFNAMRKKSYIENASIEHGEKIYERNGQSSEKRFMDSTGDAFLRKQYLEDCHRKFEEGSPGLLRKDQSSQLLNDNLPVHFRTGYSTSPIVSSDYLLGSNSHLQSPLQSEVYLRSDLHLSLEDHMRPGMLANIKEPSSQHSLQMNRPQLHFPDTASLEYRTDKGPTSFTYSKAYMPHTLASLPSRNSYHNSFHGAHGRFPTDSQLTNFQLLPQTAFPENSHQ